MQKFVDWSSSIYCQTDSSPLFAGLETPTVAGRYRYYPGEAGCDDTNPNGAPKSFNWTRKTSRRAIHSTLWSELSTRYGSRFSLLAVIGQAKWWPIPSTVRSTLHLYCQRAIGQIMPYPPKHTSSTWVRY